MIITQTPLRVSFFGGGTDFREYFQRHGGCVLSTAIDKYIFVTIKERFDDKIRIGYSQTEMVDTIDELEHELVRECLRYTGITRRIELSTMADIPSRGSGLGSSSVLTVGLLNAMYTYLGRPTDHTTLAREACAIELDVLGKPAGYQDQYIAAHGGWRFMQFDETGIACEPLDLDPLTVRELDQNLLLFFTNITRKSETVLTEQVQNIDARLDVLCQMKELAYAGRDSLMRGCIDEFGELLHEGWRLKKQLASGITNPVIDEGYRAARAAGALGGKITGAGGGGYLLLYCPLGCQQQVRTVMNGFTELHFHPERDGTKTILNYRR